MPTNDREVFQHLTDDPNHSDVSNFLTYAQFAFDRREWFAYRTREDGREPTEEMVAAWTADFTPHSFEQLRLRAQSFFDFAARDYMQDEIEAARQETLKSGVLREVSSAVEVQKPASLKRSPKFDRLVGSRNSSESLCSPRFWPHC